MHPAKILRIITCLNVGGPAQHAVFLTSGLNGRNFESKLVAGRTENHEGDMSFLAPKHAVQLIQLESLSNGAGPLGDLRTPWHLFKIIKRYKPDLVHLHLLKARFFGGIAAKVAGVPLIVETFHGHLFSDYYSRLKTSAILAAERFLGWMIVDKVVAMSERQKQDLIRYKICPEKKITVIPLGLDLGRFVQCSRFRGELRRELGVSAETVLIGTVGRLVHIKGLSYLLEAIQRIALASDIDFRLLVVGDGLLRRELEGQALKLRIENRVNFLGWRFDLERIYADLDIAVLSSLNEGTPVSLLEAMAAGKPVVATGVGGIPDVVEDGKTGLLVPSKNPGVLAEATLSLMRDRGRRQRFGEQAKASIYPKYDVSRLVENIKSFYLRLLPEKLESYRESEETKP